MLKNKYLMAVIAIAVIIGAYFAYNKFLVPKPSPYLWTEAKMGDIKEIVSETGTVKASKEMNLNFNNSGTIKNISVAVGDSVIAGTALASLDTGNLLIQVRQAEANRDSARAKLDQLLAGSSVEDINIYETAVANAKDSLARAETNLNNVKSASAINLTNAYKTARATMQGSVVTMSTALTDMDGILGIDSRMANDAFETYLGVLDMSTKGSAEMAYSDAKTQKLQAESQINALTDSTDNATVDSVITNTKNALKSVADALSKTKKLLDNSITGTGFSLTDLSAKKTIIDTDRSSVNAGLSTLEANESTINYTISANKTNTDAAESSVNAAQGAYTTATDQLALKKAAPRQADLAFYRAQVNQAEASIELIRKQISDAVLRSPVDGIITKVNYEVGEIVYSTGLSTMAVISMISANNFEIEAEVSELDINKIKPNNPADVTIDAVAENKVFSGKVVQVDPAEIVKDSDIYYRIKVILDDKTLPLKSGMTADISIVTNTKTGVIIIPERAIIKEGGIKKVRLLLNDQLNTVNVETGLKGEDMIEIISGVAVGDKVVTYVKE